MYKLMHKRNILLSLVAGTAALCILTGCSGTSDTSSAAAAEDEGSTAADAAVLRQVTLTAHTYSGTDENYIVTYDEEGRISSMACYYDSMEAPEDPVLDFTLYVDYSDGTPDVRFNDEILAERSVDDADYPTIFEVTTFDSGSLQYVHAGCGSAMQFEFNEDGLPIYCSVTQDMGDYAIEYTKDEDGRYVFAGAADEYPGHFDEEAADADNPPVSERSLHPADCEGEVLYR